MSSSNLKKENRVAQWDGQEKDKSFDSEQQQPFGDRKYSNTLPQKRGDTKTTGTSYNSDKEWSGAPDFHFGK